MIEYLLFMVSSFFIIFGGFHIIYRILKYNKQKIEIILMIFNDLPLVLLGTGGMCVLVG